MQLSVMDGESQLQWVVRNHRRRETARVAGAIIAGLLKHRWAGDAERFAAIGATIAASVDDEFRDHCRLAGLERGVLVIQVDEPALVSELRFRWLMPLHRALMSCSTGPRVTRIVFTLGEGGLSIGE